MTLFYQGPDARITHEVFEALRPSRRSYTIRELRYIHQLRATSAAAAMGSTPVVLAAGLFATVSAIAAVVGVSAFHSPLATVVAGLALVPCAVLFVQSLRVRSRPTALWAVYQGERVCLLTTRDRLAFEQVRRALLRALESAPPARI